MQSCTLKKKKHCLNDLQLRYNSYTISAVTDGLYHDVLLYNVVRFAKEKKTFSNRHFNCKIAM